MSPTAIIRTKNGEVDYYRSIPNAPATPQDITVAIAKLTANFGAKDAAFQCLLAERITANRFTAQRLNDAVNRLLDEGIYNYKISDIIGFNVSFKTYSQNDVYKAAGQTPSPHYPLVDIGGNTVWVKKEDAIKYHLKIVRDYAEY